MNYSYIILVNPASIVGDQFLRSLKEIVVKPLDIIRKFKNLIMNESTVDSQGGPASDENFIRLIQLMNQDEGFRAMLLKVIDLDQFNRSSMLNTIIHQQKIKGTSEEHLQLLRYLTDEQVCKKIKIHLKSKECL